MNVAKKRAIETVKAPKALGPYSQAIECGGFVFLSGQIPLDPATGEMVGKTAAEQTRQIMQNIQAVLEASGLAITDIVKTTIFVTDLSQFAAINAAYEQWLSAPYPARSTIQVSALPKGALVEIESIALCRH